MLSIPNLRKAALVVKLCRIGDVIMAIPAVRALHERGFEIDWLCGKAVQPLLECYSWIRAIPADENAILFGKSLQRVIGIANLWRSIAGRRYDLCATLYYDWRYRILTLPVRARQRLSFSVDARSLTFVRGRHQSSEYARILLAQMDTFQKDSYSPISPDCLPPSPLADRGAHARIAIVPGGAPNLVHQQALSPQSESLVRRWPIENYIALAERLLEQGCEVVLLGGPDDAWVSEPFRSLPVIDCIGMFSLPQVVRVCDDCDAVISNDTGPLHLAGLSQTCLIGIFGPTDPSALLPRRHYSVGIWGGQGFACRPCYDGRDFAPCQFNGCMQQVTPELVLRELDRLLSDRKRGIPSPWRIVFPESAPEAGLVTINRVQSAP